MIRCVFCGQKVEQNSLNADFTPQFEVCDCGAMYMCIERNDLRDAVIEMISTTTGLELSDVQINILYDLVYTESVDWVNWEVQREAQQIIVWVKQKQGGKNVITL